MNIDDRPFENLTEETLQKERARLQKLASECSATIGAIKAELFARSIEEAQAKVDGELASRSKETQI